MNGYRWLRIAWLRAVSLVRGSALDRETDEELRFHLDRLVEDNLARGMSAADARRAALRAMGGLEQRKEECRDARGITLVEHLWRDLGLACRQLRKHPGFALAAILSLALGVGANAAIFALLNAVSFRPLPVLAPDALVEVRLEGEGRAGRHTGRNRQWSQPQWLTLEERQQAFTDMAAFSDTRFNLAPGGEVRYAEGLWVSGSFFAALGVPPAHGRLLSPWDDRPGCGFPGAVISHSLWQRAFGGRPDLTGMWIPFGDARVPVLGVTPAGFFGVEVGRHFEVAMPLCSSGYDRRDHWWLAIVGRLRPGWTPAQARAHLAGLLPDVQRDTMPTGYTSSQAESYMAMHVNLADARAGVSPLRAAYREPLWALLGIALLVLLLASVNLANLLLARATTRHHEFSIRLALGGSRGRVVQQVLIEAVVLAVLGGLAAVGVARLVSRTLVALISTTVDPIYLDLSLDWRLVAFTLAIVTATALTFGVAPAVTAARARVFRSGTRGSTATRFALGARRSLVSLQIAVTLVLLVAALMLVGSFRNLATEDLGIQPDGVLIANVFFPASSFPPEKRLAAFRDLGQRLRALPGISQVAEAFTTPIGGSFSDRQIKVDGELKGDSYVNRVSANYFAAVGTPLVAGRDIDERDVPGSSRVAVVNERFAQQYLGAQPLGRTFQTPNAAGEPDTVYEVIGVVKNQKYLQITEPFPPIFYPASGQEPPGLTQRYIVRSALPPARATELVGTVLRDTDPTISVRYATLRAQVGDALLRERLMAVLAGLFGLVSVVLAMVGLFGVVSYGVTTRRTEIGVRVALGASRARIVGLVVGDVARMFAFGGLAGAAITWGSWRVLDSLVYGFDQQALARLAMVGLALLGVTGAMAAGWPAREAARIDPAATLRGE